MLSEAVFQPQKGSITLKKPFFCRYLFAKLCFCEEIYVSHLRISAKKTAYFTSNNALQKPTKQAITARQGVNSKPVGAKEAVRVTPPLSPHRWNTKTTPSAANKVAFKEERQGSRLRTLRLTGELDSHGYRHHPHTRKRLALFPVISKRSFLCNLIVAHLLGWVWRCLFANTGQQSGEPIVVCGPTLKALKRAFCARRFSRQPPVASTGASIEKKARHGVLYGLLYCYCCVSTSALSVYVYGLLLRKNSIIV